MYLIRNLVYDQIAWVFDIINDASTLPHEKAIFLLADIFHNLSADLRDLADKLAEVGDCLYSLLSLDRV